MITVAATYLHIVRHIYEEPDFVQRRRNFENSLVSVTRDLYGHNFEIGFYLDEGGTFLNTLVGVAALTTILSQGPSALENAIKYGELALKFGSEIIEQVGESFDVSPVDIDWKQRRRGDAKKIVSIAENAKRIREGQLTSEEVCEAVGAIQYDLYHLGNKVSDVRELAPILEELPHDRAPALPRKPEEVREPIVALPSKRQEGSAGYAIDNALLEEAPHRPRRRRIYETTLTT